MYLRRFLFIFAAFGLAGFSGLAANYDLVVYGGTSAGVIAAVQAKRMGKSVVIVCPDKHLGGLSSGGLGFTDTGDKSVIGGLSREFYQRIWQHYNEPDAWKWQKREEYGNKGQGTPAIDGAQRTMWIFEPHAAEKVFENWVKDHGIPTFRDEWLNRANGVKKDGARISSITMLSGRHFEGKMFIDATYEGDLMAAAGVDYHVGREGRDVYDEKWNGVQTGVLHHRHHFGVLKEKISPYVVAGDPKSGVLPRISTNAPGNYGEGDRRVQAYCYRMCLTDHPGNRVSFAMPEGYNAGEYELLARIFAAGWRETFDKFDPIPNKKTDTNNHGPMSTDNIGYSYDYPEASYERRREILKEHERYQKGWLYFIANDPRVPEEVRDKMRSWGLARDEFTDNGNWPRQIYVREARRMAGAHVMTENELLKRRPTPEPVGMGSYTIDSHNVQRYITPEGSVQNEGDIGVSANGPYQISYGSLVPKGEQCENLLVPVCVSSSHIAFGSIRMEPVFMILGQSAATAAALAIDHRISVQKVPYAALQKQLLKDGQILEVKRDTTRKADARVDQLETQLERLRKRHDIPGMSAAVMEKGTILWQRGFGEAEIGKRAAAADTVYHLASLTKPFASAVLLQLVQEGKLNLDSPMSEFGVQFSNSPAITVRHILTHTSEGEPGLAYKYNGSRFRRLDNVIEKITGRSFASAVHDRVLRPLGLANTSPNPQQPDSCEQASRSPETFNSRLAQGYQPDGKKKQKYPDGFSASAGMVSTVADVARFSLAWDREELLKPEIKALAWTPARNPNGTALAYGLGWFVDDRAKQKVVWHYGWWDGISALIVKVPETQLTFVLLANSDMLSRPFDLGGDSNVRRSSFAKAFLTAFEKR